MNILDFVIMLFLAASVWSGWRRGFVLQVFRLIGLIAALFVAFRFSPDLAKVIHEIIPFPASGDTGFWMSLFSVDALVSRIVAFILLFVGTRLAVRFVSRMLNRVMGVPVLNVVNRLAGASLALVQLLVILFIVISVLEFIPGPKLQALLQQSLFGSLIVGETAFLKEWLQNWLQLPKL